MNRITLALFATAAALTAPAAHADTRVSIGFNVGAPAYRVPPPVVVYAPAPVIACPPPVARGYWREVVVKTWVPERWVSSRDRWGRPVRFCEPGFYTYRTDRVWVDGRENRGGYSYAGRDPRGGWNR